MSKQIKDRALEIIELELKKKDISSIYYLDLLTTKIKISSIPVKNYIRLIKKSIKLLEKRFDETYLLLLSSSHKHKLFVEFENRNFLNFVDELTTILNENDYIRESDNLTALKGKLELGYERYFILNKIDKIYTFSPETKEYSICSKFDIKTEISFKEILFYLLTLKESKSKTFRAQLKTQEKYFKYFPKFIYREKAKNWLEIEKSLFPNDDFKIKELKKEKVSLKELDNPLIANLILKLL